MLHLDPDRLTLLALGDLTPDADDADHLTGCPTCRTEFADTRRLAELGRRTQQLRDLPAPSPAVWTRIAQQVPTSPDHSATSPGPSATSPEPSAASPQPTAAAPAADPSPPPGARSVVPAPRRPGTLRRWAVAAGTVLLAAASGAGLATWLTTSRDQPRVIATAELAPHRTGPAGAHGTAQLLDTGHGLQVRVDVAGMPAEAGYYTVWIYDGAGVMIPLGSPGPAPLNLPAAADDLTVFRIVDVSAQDLGQQQHGRSILQGTLHR